MSKKAFAIAGAYIAWIMGSGFATGQEIFQFFTSYGYKSYIILIINLIGFIIVGPAVLEAGQTHRDLKDFNHFEYFCGKPQSLGMVSGSYSKNIFNCEGTASVRQAIVGYDPHGDQSSCQKEDYEGCTHEFSH